MGALCIGVSDLDVYWLVVLLKVGSVWIWVYFRSRTAFAGIWVWSFVSGCLLVIRGWVIS